MAPTEKSKPLKSLKISKEMKRGVPRNRLLKHTNLVRDEIKKKEQRVFSRAHDLEVSISFVPVSPVGCPTNIEWPTTMTTYANSEYSCHESTSLSSTLVQTKEDRRSCQQGDGETKTVSAIESIPPTAATVSQNGDLKFEFVLFEIEPNANKKPDPIRNLQRQKNRRNTLQEKLKSSRRRRLVDVGNFSVKGDVSNKSHTQIKNTDKMRRYILKGQKPDAKISGTQHSHVKIKSNSAVKSKPALPDHPLPCNTEDFRDCTNKINGLLHKLDAGDVFEEEAPKRSHHDRITDQKEVQINVHHYSTEEDNKPKSRSRKNQSFKHCLNVNKEETWAMWNSCNESPTILEETSSTDAEYSGADVMGMRGDNSTLGVNLMKKSWSTINMGRSFRPALNADDPASLRGEKETKIPKKEALHSLQLMEQVRLLRNILSYHQKSERSGGGNPNCPICFGEDGMSDVSSLNTGLGDGNFNQLVYSSLSPMQPCLHRNMKRSHCSQDSVCFCRDCCMSWTETQLISSCCHTSQCISSDEMATEISEEFLTTESEDSDFKVMREVGYLESFLDVRLLPKEYKLHLRTDLSISLVIVFLFVCVQFFFLQNFLLL